MKNRLVLLGLAFSLSTAILVFSCKKEPDRATFPLSAIIHHSIDGQQVAFTALTHSATSWFWDFGDGTTSDEQNPVHVYEEGGYYIAKLTAMDNSGNEVADSVNLALALTPYALLTGDHTVPDYNGKTWRLKAGHSPYDKFANADADLTTADGTPFPLPSGVFNLYLGMPEVYEDEFTFYYDGSYSIDVKDDGAAFSGLLYQFVVSGGTGSTIVNNGGQDFGLVTGQYTPLPGATFTFVENEDFEVPSVYGPGGKLTFSGVSTIDFSEGSYIGILDFQRKVIVQEITETSMRLVMFVGLSQEAIGLATHALILTFEVVK